MSVIGGTLVTTKGGQPWDRLESPLEGILSYRWKSRCRLLRNRLRRHRAARRRTAPRPLPSLSQNQWSSGAGITSPMIVVVINRNQNELARTLKHEGLRVGEIIAYRAWAVIQPRWFRSGDDRLHSVAMRDSPDKPASGDVRTPGIYSFRDVIRSKQEYGYDPGVDEPLLFIIRKGQNLRRDRRARRGLPLRVWQNCKPRYRTRSLHWFQRRRVDASGGAHIAPHTI